MKQRRAPIWDMYEEKDDNHVRCKQCKKPITINNKYPRSNLQQHLYYCSHIETNGSIKKRSRIWDMYEEDDDNHVKCKQCKKSITINKKHPAGNLHAHLRWCHHLKTDDSIKKGSRIWDMYEEGNDKHVKCKRCKKSVTINTKKPTHNLYRHLRWCPHFKTDGQIKKGSRIWDMYVEDDDNHMKCKRCKKPVTINTKKPTRNLRRHLLYCPCRSPISSSSISDNDFHGNEQIRSGVRTNILIQSLKRKREVAEETDESCSSSESDEDFHKALMESKEEAKMLDLRKMRTSIVDKNAPSTSKSTGDEDFHDTVPSQSGIQIGQSIFKKKQKEEDFNLEPCSSSDSNEDFHKTIMESKKGTKMLDLRTMMTSIVDKNAPSTSRSTGNKDFHGTMPIESGIQIGQNSFKKKQKEEDFNFELLSFHLLVLYNVYKNI